MILRRRVDEETVEELFHVFKLLSSDLDGRIVVIIVVVVLL
jgi:hypothetical protein